MVLWFNYFPVYGNLLLKMLRIGCKIFDNYLLGSLKAIQVVEIVHNLMLRLQLWFIITELQCLQGGQCRGSVKLCFIVGFQSLNALFVPGFGDVYL